MVELIHPVLRQTSIIAEMTHDMKDGTLILCGTLRLHMDENTGRVVVCASQSGWPGIAQRTLFILSMITVHILFYFFLHTVLEEFHYIFAAQLLLRLFGLYIIAAIVVNVLVLACWVRCKTAIYHYERYYQPKYILFHYINHSC